MNSRCLNRFIIYIRESRSLPRRRYKYMYKINTTVLATKNYTYYAHFRCIYTMHIIAIEGTSGYVFTFNQSKTIVVIVLRFSRGRRPQG